MSAQRSTLPVAELATTAQTVARKKRNKNITGELANLSEKFGPIYGEVQQGVSAEYRQQEDKLQSVEDHILRIEMALLQEQARRVHMLSTVQSNLQEQYDTVSSQCHAQIESLRPEIPSRLTAWHQRLTDGFTNLEEERIARKIVIDRERLKLLKTVDDFEKQLDIEKVERLNRETYLLSKLSEDTTVLVENFDVERNRRELVLGHERDENDKIDAMRDKPDQIFKDDMVKRMVKATTDIRTETARRVYAEQQFVSALESYTKSLQGGLRMVNKKPLQQVASVAKRSGS